MVFCLLNILLPLSSHSVYIPEAQIYQTQVKGPCIETFYWIVYSNFLKMCKEAQTVKTRVNNVTHTERKALWELTGNKDLAIKPVDKGVGSSYRIGLTIWGKH